jgi:hypothetical protein
MMWSDERYDYFRTSDGYLYYASKRTHDDRPWTMEERRFARLTLFFGALFVALIAVAEIVFVMVILAGGA